VAEGREREEDILLMEASARTSPVSSSLRSLSTPLRRAQERYVLFPRPAPGRRHLVLVGVSGGGDSVALLHGLHALAQEWRLLLHVGHVDHGLRPDSEEDAAFVAQMARELGLPCHLHRLEPTALRGPGRNLEAQARQARYRALARMAREAWTRSGEAVDPAIVSVAVAHTATDQAETLLMRLIRGSGPVGLAGMRPVRLLVEGSAESSAALPRIHLVRPLLEVTREEVRAFLRAAGLPWREDPTNRDLDRMRNRIRHGLLPRLRELNPQAEQALARAGLLLADEVDRLLRLDQEAFARLRVHQDSDRVVLDRAGFLSLDRATQRGVLRWVWKVMGASPEALDYDTVEEIRLALVQRPGATGPHPVGGGVGWTASREHIVVHREGTPAFPPEQPHLSPGARWPVPIPGEVVVSGWRLRAEVLAREDLPPDWTRQGPWHAFLDAQRLRSPVLTTPRPGMRIQPLGMGGRSRSLGDLFTDCRVPPALRPGWPMVVDEATEQVAWVCGLRVAHPFRITEQTRRVVHLWWEATP